MQFPHAVRIAASLALFAALIITPRAIAVSTSHWTQTSAADFAAGTLDNVVATSLGNVKLSRSTHTLLTQDPRVSAIYAMAEASDGTIYAATGPQGILLKLKNGKVETAATLGNDVSCFSLLIDKDQHVLVGVGGAQGKIVRIDKPGDEPKTIFTAPEVQYIWSMVQTADGNIYAATGPNGQLFEIHSDGTNKVLYDSDENNLMSLVSDGGDLLYAGSDPNGHVYRINRKSGEAFVVYDAAETEISALAIDNHGTVYAGTGQSIDQATGADDTPPGEEKGGRPETDDGKAIPLPGEAPTAPPEPPKVPLPGPGDPPAIPKEQPKSSTHPLNMAINVQSSPATDHTDPMQIDPSDGPPTAPAPRKPRRGLPSAINKAASAPRGQVTIGKGGTPPPEGNAIYKIDREGFVAEVFREPVLVLSIIESNGTLLVATGGDGRIFQMNPAAEETATVAKLDPKEALCLLTAKDGQIYIGLANDGQIATLSSGYADKGMYTSPVLDAQQVSKFGRLHLHGQLPETTSLTVATRSGNVAEPTDAGWSKWTDETPAAQFLQIKAPAARFLQYRLTFATTDPKHSAVVDEVNVAYQMPNRAPIIKQVTASSPVMDAKKQQQEPQTANEITPKPEASPSVSISWDASDPNGDALKYSLYYRPVDGGEWILLKDKQVETTFEWNTRTVADGRYAIKVVASDAMANPQGEGKSGSRISDPIEVDNTPPVIGDLKSTVVEGGVKISTRVADRFGTVSNLEFVIDSSTDWQAVLPSDTIADSPQETYEFTIGGLSAGPHQISLRGTDDHGNQGFETVKVDVVK